MKAKRNIAPPDATPRKPGKRIHRVALYARVSTEDQVKEGFSLDAQIERLRLYAKAQEWIVAEEYVDEGYSGRETKRPRYQAMMQDIETWDIILVLKMDRVHRNSRHFMEMMDNLRESGKEFASVMENLDTGTAMGRFVMDIIQRIAQLESDQTGERVRMGMHQKARTQAGILAQAPFGMRVRDDTYVGHSRELPIVRMMFERCLKGHSLSEIAVILNSRGLRSKQGKTWTQIQVRNVLRNLTYTGIRAWGGYILVGNHKPVIDLKTFVDVQELLDRRGITASTHWKGPDFATKRREALEAVIKGESYHAAFTS